MPSLGGVMRMLEIKAEEDRQRAAEAEKAAQVADVDTVIRNLRNRK